MIEQLAAATDTELLAAVAESEAEIARAQYGQLAVLAELNSRNVAGTLGFRGLSQLIASQVRCTSAEARRRAVAVQRFGARRSLTGEPLEPQFPATAKAFAAGELGPQHAAVIADTIEAIPAAKRSEHASAVEATLLEQAGTYDPQGLRLLAGGFWHTWIRTGPARTSSGYSKPTGG